MTTHTDSVTVEDDRKLVFRVPADLHERIRQAAEEEDRSMASWIRRALEKALDPLQT